MPLYFNSLSLKLSITNPRLMCLYFIFQILRNNEAEGKKKMAELQSLFSVLSKTTTKKGIGLLEKELKGLQESQKQHVTQLGQFCGL